MKKSISDIEESRWRARRHSFVGGIELTPFCNFRCVHCYLQDCGHPGLLKAEDWKKVLDKLEKYGVLYLYFTGGEILTRPDFLEIYLYAKEKGFIVELLTNGYLLNERIIQVFDAYPPALISISVYGHDDQTYQQVTGIPDGFSTVSKNLEMLKEHQINFELKYIGMKDNLQSFDKVKQMAEKYGVDFNVSLELFPTLKGNKELLKHQLDIEEIIRLEKKIEGKMELYRNVALRPLKIDEKTPLFMCDFASNNFLIDSEGYVNPCHKVRIKEFNILDSEFHEIWNQFEKYKKIPYPKDSKCASCKYHLFCSPCMIVNYLQTGDVKTPPERTCALIRARAEEAFKS